MKNNALPFVTITIALYNAEKYIVKCLDSVANQTYKGRLECVIVDDCGTDRSVSIVEEYIKSYPGNVSFRVVHHESNQGLSEARNTGIKEAKGEYLYFLDNDDTIIPECIELMVQKVVEHPKSQIVFAGANTNLKGYEWLDYTIKSLPEYSEHRDWLQTKMLRRFDFSMTTWNKLLSIDFIKSNKLRFKKGIPHDDEYWNFQLAKYIEYASFLNVNTYNYEQYEGGIIKTETLEEGWQRSINLWNHIAESISGYNVTNQARGLCGFMFQKTSQVYPKRYKKDISRILISSSFKMSFPYNVYTLALSVLNFLNWRRFPTDRLRSRVRLPRVMCPD